VELIPPVGRKTGSEKKLRKNNWKSINYFGKVHRKAESGSEVFNLITQPEPKVQQK
jgi:hypothetical protein